MYLQTLFQDLPQALEGANDILIVCSHDSILTVPQFWITIEEQRRPVEAKRGDGD